VSATRAAAQVKTISPGALLRKPSAFFPLAMSLAALALVVAVVTTVGVTHPPDERTPAHVFQLLIFLQLPIATGFAVKWLPRAPRPALLVLFLQAGAALLAVAIVVWLEK
jgi:hypothetical protein